MSEVVLTAIIILVIVAVLFGVIMYVVHKVMK
jgi:hypothetical protein